MLTISWAWSFVGIATLYGLLCSLAGLGLMRLIGQCRGWHILPFLWLTLTFIILTQYPLPALGNVDCPVATATPQLVPFNFLDAVWRLDRREATLSEWFTNRTLAATAMNFFLCFAIGLALAPHVTEWRWAALFGVFLTLGVELTQLTGTWGIYPCAYRQFNIDDLLMNALGVMSGSALKFWKAK